jgi:hypothetical protein
MSNGNSKRVHAWKALCLPNGERIILANKYSDGEYLSLYDANHNVFRLNPQGEVVWQVRRDDSNHPADWWDILHQDARNQGYDGAREPFTYIQLEYADGTTSWDDQTLQWRDPCEWKPACKIWLVGSAYQQYILDPETGIAKNVTDWPVRPW